MIAAEDIALITGTRASDDGDLVKRCVEGDQEAWKELVIDYEGLIFSIAVRIALTLKQLPTFCNRSVWSCINVSTRFGTPQTCLPGSSR
jgi:hypothetical protein